MERYKTILATFLLAIPNCVTAQEEVFPTGMTWKEIIVEPADKIGSK